MNEGGPDVRLRCFKMWSLLFVSQALDRVEASSFPCGENSKEQANTDRAEQPSENSPKRDLSGKRRDKQQNEIADANRYRHTHHSAEERQRDRLEQKLKHNSKSR